jgi:type IV pilus assembly protein PilX
MMKSNTRTNDRMRQRGAALVIALIMLLVMTVLGIAAMQMTRMEERMAGNSRDVNLAFQGAETGLRDSEEIIRLMTIRPLTSCITAPCAVWRRDFLVQDKRDADLAWWSANAIEYGVAGTQEVTEVTRDPLIVTESLGFVPDSLSVGHGPPEGRDFYKITANSSGASDTATAVLESTYTRRF